MKSIKPCAGSNAKGPFLATLSAASGMASNPMTTFRLCTLAGMAR